MEENEVIHPSDKKTPTARSVLNPAHTLTQSLDFVKQVYKINPANGAVIQRKDLEGLVTGKIDRGVSAASQYKFLDKTVGEGYKITDLFRKVYKPVGNDFAEGMREAFKNPPLYQDLIKKFNGHVIPQELPAILFRFHGITEASADDVAKRFIENAKIVGAIDVNGALNIDLPADESQIEQPKSEVDLQNDRLNKPISLPLQMAENSIIDNTTPNPLQLPQMNNSETEKVRLTEGKVAYITYPNDLNAKDILILKKWVEMKEIAI